MHLESVYVKNFRNLADVTVPLGPGTVIVGENRSGKSNLLHALRLVLDPTLANSERTLSRDDFWDGLGPTTGEAGAAGDEASEGGALAGTTGADDGVAEQSSDGGLATTTVATYDPMAAGEQIVVRVEFGGIDGDPDAMGALGGALIEGDPMRAAFTYRFGPRNELADHHGAPLYEWTLTGGDDEDELRGDVRKYVRMTTLSALRDAERDVASWRRSPLRPLLEAVSDEIPDARLQEVVTAVAASNQRILELDEVSALSERISTETQRLVGEHQGLDATLGVAPTEPRHLLRSLRLFVDDAQRPLGSASLGALNVLYLALLLMRLERDVQTGEVAHLVLAIEEPEAHLHPHVQRSTFADVLRPDPKAERTVVVTSHSPHLVSVAPPRSLVVLRSTSYGTVVGAASEADLEDAEWDDIERYLDATRGELVFAQRVLLVEGYAETVLVPRIADAMGIDLDKRGISVCSINGTHFGTYARYLYALGTPWAVLTDGDPDKQVTGARRVELLLDRLGVAGEDPKSHGIFIGDVTLEQDVIAAHPTNAAAAVQALASLALPKVASERVDAWRRGEPIDAGEAMDIVSSVGKGLFAQRLASGGVELIGPEYILSAVTYLMA